MRSAKQRDVLPHNKYTLTTMKTRKYSPTKYYTGLSPTAKTARRKEIEKYGSLSSRNPRAYRGFATDVGVRTKQSNYTSKWKTMFPDATSLEEKAAATGVPLRFIRQVYNRGMAAWRTGHRPGATQQQWGYARVHSFLLRGKTYYTADADIVEDAKHFTKWWK